MPTLNVEIQDAAFKVFSRAAAHQALAELIWNALDADASKVLVDFVEADGSGGISEIHISDDGEGISIQDLHDGFEKLGSSWKKHAGETRSQGRVLHGKEGQGRYKAYALGRKVSWETRTLHNGKIQAYSITGSDSNPKRFNYTNPAPTKKGLRTGTKVVITEIHAHTKSLKRESAFEEIHKTFALYLKRYPKVQLVINGILIDPKLVQIAETTFPIHFPDAASPTFLGDLVIVEWTFSTPKSVIFCNGKGVALSDHSLRLNTHGISFTAYLKSDWFDGKDIGDVENLTLSPTFAPIENMVVARIKEHVQDRAKRVERETIERWKEEDVYPYSAPPTTIEESIEQSVFAACAIQINQALPDFSKAQATNRKLSLRLIREALETNPDSLKAILTEVIGLTPEQQNDFAELLQETSLSAVITTSRTIADRLRFLEGLDILLFEPESTKALKERKQLHKLLARHPWIFGEEYNLSLSDRHLTRALERHINLLGRQTANLEPVRAIGGTDPGIIDLMLTKTLRRGEDELEHLVIELKRPSQDINGDVLDQIKKYALAVAKDSRFHEGKVKWKFWAVSNDMNDEVRAESRQKGKPRGLARDYDEPDVQIWVRTWGEIIEECRGRLQFYQKQLGYQPDREAALKYLQSINPDYIPEYLRTSPILQEDPEEELVGQMAGTNLVTQ